jgi:hypothetical protein
MVKYGTVKEEKTVIDMLQEFQFKNDPIHLQGEVSHVPGDQDKYRTQKNIVASVSFFVCNQKDAYKQELEGDQKRDK